MMNKIFYLTNDPERAIGLEKIIKDLHIVCVDDNEMTQQLINSGCKVFCLEKELGIKNAIFRNSYKLLSHELTQKYITAQGDNEQNAVITFKISPPFEKSVQNLGLKQLNTSSVLNRRFENKIQQYNFLSRFDSKIPLSFVSKLSDTDFDQISRKLGLPFVIQFDRGHTGTGTIFIQNKNLFDELKNKFSQRFVKFSKYVEGEAWTINAVTTRFGTFYGGLSYQITGIEQLTENKGATVGNDWTQISKLSQEVIEKISSLTENIGNKMFEQGFQGMFGLDLIITNNDIHLIEINARQPASTSMHTKLMLLNDQIPLQLLHIAEFLAKDEIQFLQIINSALNKTLSLQKLDELLEEQNDQLAQGYNASQFVIRNQGSKSVHHSKELLSGVYSAEGEYLRAGYSISDLQNENEFLLLLASADRFISHGSEIARIQAKESVLNEESGLKMKYNDIVERIKSIKMENI